MACYEHFPVALPAGEQGVATMFDGLSIYSFDTMAQADACWALPEVLADTSAFVDMDEMVELKVTRRLVFRSPAPGSD